MKIDIPNPCPESWSGMLPIKEGAFCQQCEKKVFDFTKKSGEEIKSFLEEKSGEKICAKMSQEQILEMNFDNFFSKFRLWNIWRRAAVVMYFIFGMGLFSCGSKDEHVVGDVQEVGKVQMTDTTTKNSPTTTVLKNDSSDVVRTDSLIKKGDKKVVKKDTVRHLMGKVKIDDTKKPVVEVGTIQYQSDNKVGEVESEIKQDPKNHPPPLPLAPEYRDGKAQMEKIISSNLKYPEPAKKNKIEGTILVMFNISADGKMSNIKLQNKLGYGCDEEAVRLVKLLKDWKPGKQGGKAIAMDFGVAVEFKLP
jgi:TonB family protein